MWSPSSLSIGTLMLSLSALGCHAQTEVCQWSETAGELGLDLVTVRPSGSLESADELGLDLVAESIISSKVGAGMGLALSRLG